jgi:hypothetical protein
MSLQLVAGILLGLAIVGLLISRQLVWHTFDPARVLRLPVALAAVGLFMLARTPAAVSALDLTFLLIELAASVALGAAMGVLTQFRADPAAPTVPQIRAPWFAASLWVVLIAVRLGMDAVASALGAHLLGSTGVILLVIATLRATSGLVARTRLPQAFALSA